MTMDRAMKITLVALCSVGLPLRGWAQFAFPKASDGYDIKKTADVDQPAPSGYEGKNTSVTMTATGNTPATAGKTYVMTVNLSLQVPDCPQADGTENGDGELSIVSDFKNQQASGPSNTHVDAHSKAKFKGKVDDDAKIINPITADFDYAFSQSGSSGGHGAPIASAASTNAAQHLTIQVAVGGADIPQIGKISGVDYWAGHSSDAVGMAYPVAFLGGAFYNTAQTHWSIPDSCVRVSFDPPSFSRQPVPGSDVKVNGYIKTRGGEGVRGKFIGVEVVAGDGSVLSRAGTDERVSITSSNTDPGSPAIFVYTAPSKKLSHMGLGASATSRGGSAVGIWETGLGTNWSGEITVSKISPGVDRASDLITSHHYEATRITINLKDGVGTANGYSEVHGRGENRHYVSDGGGKSHIEVEAYDTDEGMVQGNVKATGGVLLDTLTHHYTVNVGLASLFPTGKRSRTSCARGQCTSRDDAFSVESILPLMGGKLVDLNHVSGSMDLGKAPLFPGASPVAGSYIVTWDLSRQGTTK